MAELPQEDLDYDVVVAIDIGTSYSGFAYGFKDEKEVHMNVSWKAPHGCASPKTLSDVYITKDNKKQFGYDAQNMHIQRVPGHYFHAFKMKIQYDKNRNIPIVTDDSPTPHEISAKDLFADIIRHFKEHALEQIRRSGRHVGDTTRIRWVLTVPGKWDDLYKVMLRQAAHTAGLIQDELSYNLLIAQEPEVAAFYCRTLPVEQFSEQSEAFNKELKKGAPYMVIDAGGGTVDFAYQLAVANGFCEEIIAPTCGKWGGGRVRSHFERILADVLGKDFVNFCKNKKISEWTEMMSLFGTAKRNLDYKKDKPWTMSLPCSFSLAYDNFKNRMGAFQEAVNKNKTYFDYPDGEFNGRFEFKYKVAWEIFSMASKEIVDHARTQIEKLSRDMGIEIKYLYLVGGFANSPILQECLKTELQHKGVKIAVPACPEATILKGAVMFGKQPNAITSRAPHTYCLSVLRKIDNNTKDNSQGDFMEALEPILEKDQIIEYKDKKIFQAVPVQCKNRKQKLETIIYSTSLRKDELNNVKIKGNKNIKKLATVHANVSSTVKSANIIFTFFGTEMAVTVKDAKSEKCYAASVEYDFSTMK